MEHQQVNRAKEALAAVKARVLGLVLSAVAPEGKDGYYYYAYKSGDARSSTE